MTRFARVLTLDVFSTKGKHDAETKKVGPRSHAPEVSDVSAQGYVGRDIQIAYRCLRAEVDEARGAIVIAYSAVVWCDRFGLGQCPRGAQYSYNLDIGTSPKAEGELLPRGWSKESGRHYCPECTEERKRERRPNG